MERKAVLYGEVESSRIAAIRLRYSIAQFMELLSALNEADDCLAKVRDGADPLLALLDGLAPVEELRYVDGILDELSMCHFGRSQLGTCGAVLAMLEAPERSQTY
ncbi:DNA mismatch repair protein msh6 [Perkinsus olseni]|uniref:DNA mismatch repair protein msh6 n=1 Tax=Perkinsus olseni TaxID=32597 RepID=A0A7J6MKR4_PEROL|nr:DNA mismatch repair protein msh6 [Perkinsus olseni]KAF4672153.1 DNA mismatch repair protein msh6 [Perkinsus olseni]